MWTWMMLNLMWVVLYNICFFSHTSEHLCLLLGCEPGIQTSADRWWYWQVSCLIGSFINTWHLNLWLHSRWFDKCFTASIQRNAWGGHCVEHSAIDAMVSVIWISWVGSSICFDTCESCCRCLWPCQSSKLSLRSMMLMETSSVPLTPKFVTSPNLSC